MGKSAGLEWILKCAEDGSIATLGLVSKLDHPPDEDRSEWGPMEKIGIRSDYVKIPVVRGTSFRTNIRDFWALPPDLVRRMEDVEQMSTSSTHKVVDLQYVSPMVG